MKASRVIATKSDPAAFYCNGGKWGRSVKEVKVVIGEQLNEGGPDWQEACLKTDDDQREIKWRIRD